MSLHHPARTLACRLITGRLITGRLLSSLAALALIGVAGLGAVGCGDKPVFTVGDTGLGPDAGDISEDTAEPDTDGFSGEIDPQVEDAYEKLRLSECSMIFKCCDAAERDEKFGLDPADDEEDCQTEQTLIPIEVELAMISEAVELGRVQFDPSMVDLCLQSYADQACGDWTEPEPTATRLTGCPEVITPLVEAGDDCKFDYECITGYCTQSEGDGPGSCAEPAAEGEACDERRCAEDLYCDLFSVECVAKRANGASCMENQDCRSDNCAARGTGELVCTAPTALCGQ